MVTMEILFSENVKAVIQPVLPAQVPLLMNVNLVPQVHFLMKIINVQLPAVL